MKRIFSKEVVIGLCVLIALVVLFLGIDFLKGVNVFAPSNYYYSTYTNVEGLAVSSPVRLNGFKVGQVRDIRYDYANPGHVIVEMSLDRKLQLPKGTKAVLATDILGTAGISLEMATAEKMHLVGDTIQGMNASGLMDALSQDLMPSAAAIFPKVDTLLTNINALVADPAMVQSVKRLDAITASLELTTRRLALLTASLQPITADVKNITGNVSTITSDLTSLSGTMANLPLDSLVLDLQATTANLRALSEELDNPNSTLGKVLHDPTLYNNLNSTISSLDSLFVDIKKNPKRYISIKLL